MLAAGSHVVVSLSVESTSPQTRAGDACGRHPLASAANVFAKEVVTRGQGLEMLSLSPYYTVST